MEKSTREMIASVRNPYRYIGGEPGSIRKDWDSASVRICLVFPDTYELGMSHIGLSILYSIINSSDDWLAERSFSPWIDMEEALTSAGRSLFSLESGRPLSEFDIVGISLGYELTYSNALTVLDLSGIPIRAKHRSDGDPIVIAGGPCTYNPMPVAPFFDAIVIGDGEEISEKICRIVANGKRSRCGREKILEELSNLEGVFVPVRGIPECGVGRALIHDLNRAKFPRHPVVPYFATQMRAAVEVSRGCARGCRFCQAGYIYRPVRQRSCETAVGIVSDIVKNTGHEDFSFLSLSVSDWPPLQEALAIVHKKSELPIDASLPSLRVEALTDGMMKNMGSARSGSFTLAPEAGTERMRRAINKGNTDGDLYASVEKIFSYGWHAVKLYFMIGLPGETQEDLDGIAGIAKRCLEIGRRRHRRAEVTVSTSTFIPKPHTPFQWEKQISAEETIEKQDYLKRVLRGRGLFYRWHDANMSWLEGIFARGGAELADVIEAAQAAGARFDGWDEMFRFDIWRSAFEKCGIDPSVYLFERPEDYLFPWDSLRCGPSRKFLIDERRKSRELLQTEDCTAGICSACGLCDPSLRNLPLADLHQNPLLQDAPKDVEEAESIKFRLKYSKTGGAAFLGGIETADIWRIALRASGLRAAYSSGYHPRIKVSVGSALPVGMESECEFVDIELLSNEFEEDILNLLNERLPQGFRVEEVSLLPPGAASIEKSVEAVRYEVLLPWLSRGELEAGASRLRSNEPVFYVKKKGDRERAIDLKEQIAELDVLGDGAISVTIRSSEAVLRPSHVISALYGAGDELLSRALVRKLELISK
ncbi:MAG TPA: TIGR03960 family B12-binding radical SAM protein [bacterium]|nr:TIGR03960 family B12-binding radical SAM protein [bacterium]